MITLYMFGPYFGLPDASPFVMKAEVLLKMAGLSYAIDTGGFNKAPKGKLPYIADDGEQRLPSAEVIVSLMARVREQNLSAAAGNRIAPRI
jgi:hypothetical protein